MDEELIIMNIFIRLFRTIKRRICGISVEEANHQWLLQHGLREGQHVDCFSWNGVDAQYPGLITIGDYVTIASNCKLLAHDAAVGYVTKSTRVGIIEIGNHCFIGAGSIILPNVRIGDWSIIGAGSVVSKDVPPHSVYAGNPAKYICSIEEYTKKHEEGLKTLPVSFRNWREWANATPNEWIEFRKQLSDTYGYVTTRSDIERE